MSGVYSTTPNYSGRQGDNTQNIKQFVTSAVGIVNWVYKTIAGSTTKVITPYDQTKTVMIPKDLLVLGSINNPSDIILKDNIEQINIEDFNKLNPVSFNYRKKDSETNEYTDELYDNTNYGFIADEVEKINKDLVFYKSDSVTLAGVEYNNMIAILTKAIQELSAKVDAQAARIEELENK